MDDSELQRDVLQLLFIFKLMWWCLLFSNNMDWRLIFIYGLFNKDKYLDKMTVFTQFLFSDAKHAVISLTVPELTVC